MLIIHGENQIASRQLFLAQLERAKKDDAQIIHFTGSDVTLPALTTAAESISLFGQANYVFIQEFFSRRPSNEKKQIVEYLLAHPALEIVCWESKDVAAQVKTFPVNIVKSFALPKYIFEFLDTLSLDLFHKTLTSAPPEQIFASLATRIHKVITGEGRLKKQISQEKLLVAYENLLKIDYAQKTSSSPFDLTGALELWLLKL